MLPTADPAAIRAAVMAAWAIKPAVFYGQQQMSQKADLTGQQMVPWQDHWKLVALVLRQILYRVVAKFLRYRWHSLVEEPQRCAGICMTSPLDRELRLLSDFPARRLTAVLFYTKRLQFPRRPLQRRGCL